MNENDIFSLAKKLWSENEEVAIELANIIFGIRDGDYDEPEFTYPLYFKSINGNICKFIALNKCEYLYYRYGTTKAGEITLTTISHTDTDVWTPIAFSKKRGIWDKAIVRVYDNGSGYTETIKFFDAYNDCCFTWEGKRDGIAYDHYEIVENPSSNMLELQKTLED